MTGRGVCAKGRVTELNLVVNQLHHLLKREFQELEVLYRMSPYMRREDLDWMRGEVYDI